jgi:hypothetical protein
MRILQLDVAGHGSRALDLHPRLSVITGLSPDERHQVAAAAARIPTGSAGGARGLLEANGVLLELSDANLALLECRREVPNVLGAADLPGAHDPAELRMMVERHLLSWPIGKDPDLDAARSAYESAKATCDHLRRAAGEMRDALHAASLERERAQSDLHHASADLDPLAPKKLEDARRRLTEIEIELGIGTSEPPEDRLARVQARIVQLEDTLAHLDPKPTGGVERALELVRNPPQGGEVPDPEAQALADAVEAIQAEIVAFEESLAEDGISLSKTLAELEESKAELAEAEARLARREPTPEEKVELEGIQDQIHELEPKTESRLGGAKARKQIDDLLERQGQILDRLGYATWTEYVMGAAFAGIDPEQKERVERAKIDVEVREGRWARLAERLETEPEYRAMLDRLESVYLAAFDVLEGREPDDPAAELRKLTKVVEPTSPLDAAADLWDALEEAGVELPGDELPFEAIVAAAEQWLAEQHHAGERRPVLERELAEARLELAEAEEAVQQASNESSEPEIPDDPAWAAQMAKVNGAQARLDRYLAAKEEVAPLEAAVEQAIQAERAAQAEVEAAEARVKDSSVTEREARASLDTVIDRLATDPAVVAALTEAEGMSRGPDPEVLDMFLLTSLTALRGFSYAGSLPLVLDGLLDGFDTQDAYDALARIERLTDAVQVLVVTDRSELADWADSLGIERAAVIEPGVVPT